MPPAVEDALLATKPGTIHPKVVRSPRGFHVLWRLD
jgi:parvulin-like peptidyl-prolyl isomerase